jgi:cytochrome c
MFKQKMLARFVFSAVTMSLANTPAHAQPTPNAFTAEEARSGRDSYGSFCTFCHGKNLEGSSGPSLIGKAFKAGWSKHSVAELYVFVQHTMPFCAGGSLSDAEYANIIAYILSRNEVEAGTTPFDAKNNANIGAMMGAPSR